MVCLSYRLSIPKPMKVVVRELSRFESMQGLLGKRTAEPIHFQTRWGIHTFFMHFPIDVIILDSTFHIVKMKKNLMPWHIFLWNPRYNHVLELPVGVIQKNNWKIGDIITLH